GATSAGGRRGGAPQGGGGGRPAMATSPEGPSWISNTLLFFCAPDTVASGAPRRAVTLREFAAPRTAGAARGHSAAQRPGHGQAVVVPGTLVAHRVHDLPHQG